MESNRKVYPIEYKTMESESIVFCSTAYAVVSLLLVGVIFRFFLSDDLEKIVISLYAGLSVLYLFFMGNQSKRRAELNKLPSSDILDLCYLIKESGDPETGRWYTTRESFNERAMERFFTYHFSQVIPPHDYFSYMLSEGFLEIRNINDMPLNTNLQIYLSSKAESRLNIYEKSTKW